MKKLPWILVCILSVALMCSIRHNAQLMNYANTYTDTLTVLDTIPFDTLIPRDSVVVRYKYITIPLSSDTTNNQTAVINPNDTESSPDSILISLPITQRKYETKLFTAWVSGYDPHLDSCLVYPEKTTIIQKTKEFNWAVGAQIGLDMFNNAAYPHISLSVFTHTKSKWDAGAYLGVRMHDNGLKPFVNVAMKCTLFSW